MAGAKKSVGEKRAAARRQNRELRDYITGMTNQQLRGFFAGFDPDQIARITKTIDKVKDDLRANEIQKIDDQIKQLEEMRQQLAGK